MRWITNTETARRVLEGAGERNCTGGTCFAWFEEWQGSKIPRKTSGDIPLPTKISSKVAAPAPRKRARTAGSGYALIDDLKTYLPSLPSQRRLLQTNEKKLLDLNVSETAFNSAIDFLSRFFAALGKQGYWVRLAEGNEGLHCKGIDIKEDPKEGGLRYDSLWRPCSASIICVGDMLFAFNLAEMTEYVPAEEVDGRYIRDETMIRWMRENMTSHFAMSLNMPYLPDDSFYSSTRHTRQLTGRLSFARQNSAGL